MCLNVDQLIIRGPRNRKRSKTNQFLRNIIFYMYKCTLNLSLNRSTGICTQKWQFKECKQFMKSMNILIKIEFTFMNYIFVKKVKLCN